MSEPQRPGTLVLLHAAGLNGSVWAPVASLLAGRGYAVLCPDLAGHGSKRNLAVDTLPEVAAEAALSLRTVARPLTLIGLSVGGMVAQLVAGSMPDDIGALVLCDTIDKPADAMAAALHKRAERTRRIGAAGMVNETVARWFGSQAAARQLPVIATVRRLLAAADTEANARIWEAIATFDGRPSLAQLAHLRALIVCGEHDAATPAEYSASLARRLPRGRMVSLPGLGHMAPLEQPDDFAGLVSDFLEEA